MPKKITLIFTRHKESGFCTADALLKIIEAVQPNVIFEELSEINYDKVYREKSLETLESDAVKKYLENNSIPHIPVDCLHRSVEMEEEQDRLWSKLTAAPGQPSFQLRSLLEQQMSMVTFHGFDFLNSIQNDLFIESIEKQKEEVLQYLQDEGLFQLAKRDKEIIHKREEVMLNKVYEYFKENEAQNALMFIGSGHRKAIISKIEERLESESLKLNWQYFSDIKPKLS